MLETDGSGNRRHILRWAGYLYLFNLLFCLLISLRYLGSIEIPVGFANHLFTAGAFVGHFTFLAFLPCLIVVLCSMLSGKKMIVMPLSIILYSFLALFIAIDTMVFSLYRFHINGMVLHLLFGGAAGDIFEFSFRDWFVAAFAGICIICIEWTASVYVWKIAAKRRKGVFALAAAVVLLSIFIAQNFAYALAEYSRFMPVTIQKQYLPFYRPLTMKKTIGKNLGFFRVFGVAEAGAKEQSESGMSASRGFIRYPLQEPDCKPQQKKMNIIMIVIDSWRFDTFSDKTTPKIFDFASSSWNFSRHYSGGNATRSGIMSIFYGIPATHNFWMNLLLEKKGPVFVHQMLTQGYKVKVFASASMKSPEFNQTVFSEVKDIRLTSPGDSSAERDLSITREFLDFLKLQKREDGPFFAFLFYDAPHAYSFPADYKTPFMPYPVQVSRSSLTNDTDPAPYFNKYKNSVHFVDHEIGEVLRAVGDRGLLDDSIVIITADHGEEFNDNGKNFWGHGSNFTDPQVHVPLLIHWPGKGGKVLSHQTSHHDIVPTLMHDTLGCGSSFAAYSTGSHLLDVQKRPYLIIGGYYDYAIMEPSQIDIVTDGMLQVKNYKWSDMPGSVPNRAILSDATSRLMKFMK